MSIAFGRQSINFGDVVVARRKARLELQRKVEKNLLEKAKKASEKAT